MEEGERGAAALPNMEEGERGAAALPNMEEGERGAAALASNVSRVRASRGDGVARALAPEPKLIIADEPVSALDVSIQSQILNLIKSLQKDLGLTMIFISHDLGVVHYIADRIAVMYQGKIVESGEAGKVFHEPQADYTKRLLASIPKLVVNG
jgi:ABC-type glutathione transport system ATPase component